LNSTAELRQRILGTICKTVVGWAELPRSPGHAFYDRLQAVLIEAGLDGFAEALCAPYYASRRGRPSLPPGRYFRMHLVGYFEGIDSERGLEWRCSDSLSLREFLRCGTGSMPLASIKANAALRTIVRRDSGEGYREMLERLAAESGIATPTAEELIRLDRQRKGRRPSNEDWASPVDPEARIAKLKDGRSHLAYKPEHAVDLDTWAIVAAEIHAADRGDTATLPETLKAAEANLAAVDAGPTAEQPTELVADKGYQSRDGLKGLEDGPWKKRIAEKKQPDVCRWHGDEEARRAVYNNRARLRSGVAREAFKLRAELVERGFALTLDRGGMRRAWLRGRENLQKRYLVHFLTITGNAPAAILVVATDTEAAMLVVSIQPQPPDESWVSSTGC